MVLRARLYHMTTKLLPSRLTAISALVACVALSVSCMTTYDAYGRPVQSVDPGAAVVGAAAAGIAGYAIGNSHHHDHYNHGYYGGGYYGGGYYAPRGYYRARGYR